MRLHSLTILIALLLGLAACEDSATPADQGKDSDDDVEESKDSSNADDDAEDDDDDDDDDDEPVATKEAGSSSMPREAGSSSMRSDAGPPSSRMDASKPVDTSKSDASTPSSNDGGGSTAPSGESPCPGNGMPCKILPLGDSITDGFGVPGGYRIELFKKALAASQSITFVGSAQNGPAMVEGKPFPKAHEGHSGWTIDQVAGLVPSPALTTKPDIVLLMAGTNDVNLKRDLPNAPKRLGALIDKLTAADDRMLIVVAQLTPLEGTFSPDSPAAVKTFNQAIPAVVESRASQGKHVVLVDMHTGFPLSELNDGVHPNQKGYERMGAVWYEAIKGVLR